MSRQKSLKAVVTFASLDDALAVEECARTHDVPGRTIPVPSEVSAGCGLAWMAPESDRARLLAALGEHDLSYEGVYGVWMW